jgi:hypothetical protein
MFYTVKWLIEVEAETPKEAAEKALKIQRDPESIATFFDVSWMETTRFPSGETHSVRHESIDLKPQG